MALPTKIIVTGAAQGIGRAVALRLAAPGAHIAVWDVLKDAVEETAKLCMDHGAVARAYTVDVGDADLAHAVDPALPQRGDVAQQVLPPLGQP